MEFTDRQNWLLSAIVGALIAANGVVWLLVWEDLFGRVVGVIMVGAGVLATVNAIRAMRGASGVEPIDWTPRKTLINVLAVVLFSIGLFAFAGRLI